MVNEDGEVLGEAGRIYVSLPGKGLGGSLVLIIAGAGQQGLLEIESKRNDLGEW